MGVKVVSNVKLKLETIVQKGAVHCKVPERASAGPAQNSGRVGQTGKCAVTKGKHAGIKVGVGHQPGPLTRGG